MFESLLDGTLENYTTCVSTDYLKKCLCTHYFYGQKFHQSNALFTSLIIALFTNIRKLQSLYV